MKKISKKMFNYIRDFVRVLLVVLIFSTIFVFWNLNQRSDYYQQYINHSTELRILVIEIPKYAQDALMGPDRESVFRELKSAAAGMDEHLGILFNGIIVNQREQLPPTNEKIRLLELNTLSDAWQSIKPNVNTILDNQALILDLSKSADTLVANLNKLQTIYFSILDELGTEKIENNQKIVEDARQTTLTDELSAQVESVLKFRQNPDSFLKSLSENSALFIKNAGLLQMDLKDVVSAKNLNEMGKYVNLVNDDIDALNKVGQTTAKINLAIFDIVNQGALLRNLSQNLETAYINYPKTNVALQLFGYGLGFLSFLVLIVSIQIFYREGEENLKMIEEKNALMQEAVEKLLKELPEIASGNSSLEDLAALNVSSHPTQLSESFTYALTTLRKLVFNIGKMAQNVSMAAADAQKISEALAVSSSNQAQEISEVTASVSAMANTIEQVSTNANASASVALESVKIAGQGGKVVRSTIGGMERIQTQIQETSNFMRRLSDSSQEIGEIVSLIDGIADQTNILSLNAAIQAAMAGEAGRGFAVVADEVQRLAEKVSYATKEIGSLVRSIQTDTTQVIVAMEETKTQVLEGVSSAQAAGSTLEQIETVSRKLSNLIQNISLSAGEQAIVSGRISHIMNDIKDIAQKTATGSTSTVTLIEKLSKFVTDLRNSVLEL